MQYTEAMSYQARHAYTKAAQSVLGPNARTAGYSESFWACPSKVAKTLCGGKPPRPGYLVYVDVPGVRKAWVSNEGGNYVLTLSGLV